MVTDWFRVICDLSRLGWSEYRISAAINVPKSTLIGWKQGAEPRYNDGQQLLNLWFSEMTKAHKKSLAAHQARPVLVPGDFRGNHSHRRRHK